MSGKITVARVVTVLHLLIVVTAAIGIYIATVSHSLPAKWQTSAAAIGGIVASIGAGTAGVIKFLQGNSTYETMALTQGNLVSNPQPTSGQVQGVGLVGTDQPDEFDPEQFIQSRQPDPAPEPQA